MTDPIADMLTRIRNAQVVHKKELILPYSNIKFAIAQILFREGYLGKLEKIMTGNVAELKIELKYLDKRDPAIKSIKRISKPGRRVYSKYYKLPFVLNNLGIAVVSTSKGVMTQKEAKKQKLGGEIICEVY